jgi:hypothetical protein
MLAARSTLVVAGRRRANHGPHAIVDVGRSRDTATVTNPTARCVQVAYRKRREQGYRSVAAVPAASSASTANVEDEHDHHDRDHEERYYSGDPEPCSPAGR